MVPWSLCFVTCVDQYSTGLDFHLRRLPLAAEEQSGAIPRSPHRMRSIRASIVVLAEAATIFAISHFNSDTQLLIIAVGLGLIGVGLWGWFRSNAKPD